MAKVSKSFPVSAKWVYVFSIGGVTLIATNGQRFTIPAGFYALSRDEIQSYFTNNYVTIEYDDGDLGFSFFCYDFTINGVQPASDVTVIGMMQQLSGIASELIEINATADNIASNVADSLPVISAIKINTDSLVTSLSSLVEKVESVGGDVSAIKTVLDAISSDVSLMKSDLSTIDSTVTDIASDLSLVKTDVSEIDTAVSDIKTNSDSILELLAVEVGNTGNIGVFLTAFQDYVNQSMRLLNTISAGVQLLASNSTLPEVADLGLLQAVYDSSLKCFKVVNIPSTVEKFKGSFVFQNSSIPLSGCGRNASVVLSPADILTFSRSAPLPVDASISGSVGSFSIPVKFFNELGGEISGISFDSSNFSSSVSSCRVAGECLVQYMYLSVYYNYNISGKLVVSFEDGSLVFSCESAFSLSSSYNIKSSSSYLSFDNSKAISFSN